MAQHYCKYYKQRKYVSYDGITWQPLNEYRKGALYEFDSSDCGYMTEYKWQLVDGYLCSGTTEYQKLQKYESVDGGISWYPSTPEEYLIGEIIRENSINCSLSKWVYTIEDGSKPTSYCSSGGTGAYMDEGIAKTIKFTSGVHVCECEPYGDGGYHITWDVAHAYAYYKDYDYYKTIDMFHNGTGCSIIYDTYNANGKAISGTCYTCCSCCLTCACWDILEYMPWLENASTMKIIYRQKYTRATTADTWTAVSGTKEFYSVGEKWIYVSSTAEYDYYQHQLASVDEYGNITWTDDGDLVPYEKASHGDFEYIDELYNDGDSYIGFGALSGSFTARMTFAARHNNNSPRGTVAKIRGAAASVNSTTLTSCTYSLLGSCLTPTYRQYGFWTNDTSYGVNASLFASYINSSPVTFDNSSISKDVYIKYVVIAIGEKETLWRPAKVKNTNIRGLLSDNGVSFLPLSKYQYCSDNSKLCVFFSDGTNKSFPCNGSTSFDVNEISGVSKTAMTSAVIGECVTNFNTTKLNESRLSSVIIGSNVRIIGANAFYYCSRLTSIDIPNSVTTIGYQAFNLSGLATLTIPSGVTSIGDRAFYGCTGLTYIIINAATPPTLGGDNTFGNTNDCPIYVPSGSVNTYKAASRWSLYSSRIFPYLGTKLYAEYSNGSSNFITCNSSSVLTSGETRSLNTISTMKKATVGECVTEIGYSAFSGATSLTSLTMHNEITTLGNQAFMMCSGLTSFNFPSGLTRIEGSCFRLANGITSITVPSGVTYLGSGAFADMGGLTAATIPSSVTEIRTNLFLRDSALKEIHFKRVTAPIIAADCVKDCTSLEKIYIPTCESFASYAATEGLSAFTSYFYSEDTGNKCT